MDIKLLLRRVSSKGMMWPRVALWLLIAAAGISAALLLLGYTPAVIGGGLSAPARAVFFTSALTAIAAVLGLSIAGLLTTEQLDLERQDRKKDRRLTAKHAVLIDAIRGINQMLAQLSRLAAIEVEQADISQTFSDGYSQAAPAWAVADVPTVSVLQKLTNELSMQFMKLSQERLPLVQFSDDCEALEKCLMSAHVENTRLFRMQSDARGLGDSASEKRWSDLYQISVAQMPEMRKERDNARVKLANERIPYMFKCIFKARQLRDEFHRMVGHVRIEIGVDEEKVCSLDKFIEAADLEDQRFIHQFKKMFVGYDNLIDEFAREAGCR